MKSTTIASLLAIVPAVLCAPVPIVLVQDLEAAPRHSSAGKPTRSSQRLPGGFLFDDGEAAVQIAIDNRPVTPASGVDPTIALATPQPVATTYLLSLAKHASKQAQAANEARKGKFSTPTVAEETGLPRKVGMPCYMHYRRRDSTDVLAISLVATFLLVIVIVETWEGVCERARSFACAQGPIHLDFDEEPFDEKVPLSVQADEGYVEGEQEQPAEAL